MTRPGGVTPRKALPYPGSTGVQAETPRAIQSLAEAIDRQLSSVAGGYKLGFWSGLLSIDSGSRSVALSIPGLASIVGGVVSYGTFAGGAYRVGWPSGISGSKFYMMAAKERYLPAPETFAGATVSVCIVAWGPPA